MSESVKIYKVGGCVRDYILGQTPNDIDYSVINCRNFQHMKEVITSKGCKIYLEKKDHGVIRANYKGEPVDFSLAKTFGSGASGIDDDLSWRDFTVNAMAMDESGNIIDPHGGEKDTRDKILRCVQSSEVCFSSDPCRMLRALRFHIVKGFTLSLELETALKIEKYHTLLRKVSHERKREELNKMFKHDTVATLKAISSLPDTFAHAVFSDELWLKATSEKRK